MVKVSDRMRLIRQGDNRELATLEAALKKVSYAHQRNEVGLVLEKTCRRRRNSCVRFHRFVHWRRLLCLYTKNIVQKV